MSDSYFDLPSRIEDDFAEIDSDIVMDLLLSLIHISEPTRRS